MSSAGISCARWSRPVIHHSIRDILTSQRRLKSHGARSLCMGAFVGNTSSKSYGFSLAFCQLGTGSLDSFSGISWVNSCLLIFTLPLTLIACINSFRPPRLLQLSRFHLWAAIRPKPDLFDYAGCEIPSAPGGTRI